MAKKIQWRDPVSNILYTVNDIIKIVGCTRQTAWKRLRTRINNNITTEVMLMKDRRNAKWCIHPATGKIYTTQNLHEMTGYSLPNCRSKLALFFKQQISIEEVIRVKKNGENHNSVLYIDPHTGKKYNAKEIASIKNSSTKTALRYMHRANKGEITSEELFQSLENYLKKGTAPRSTPLRKLDKLLTSEKKQQIRKDLAEFKRIGDEIEAQEKRLKKNQYQNNRFSN